MFFLCALQGYCSVQEVFPLSTCFFIVKLAMRDIEVLKADGDLKDEKSTSWSQKSPIAAISVSESMNCIACPSCLGNGYIPRDREDELVALIPFSDKRLKPSKTWMWVISSILICLLLSGLALYFLLPRTINVFSNSLAVTEVFLQSYEPGKTMKVNFMTFVNVSNENFYDIEVTNASSKVSKMVFPNRSEVIGYGFNKSIVVVPKLSSFYPIGLNVTVTLSDWALAMCELSYGYIRLYFQFTLTFSYLLHHREQNTLETSQLMPSSIPFQKVLIYETPSRFYLTGAHYGDDSYHLLKVEKAETLTLIEDGHIYSQQELNEILTCVDECTVKRNYQKNSDSGEEMNSLENRTFSCYGIAGFARFLNGYYMLVVSKAIPLVEIGFHTIFKVEETSMLALFDENSRSIEELKYCKIFQSILLSTSFYFCYTYDLSRTLQSNATEPTKHWHDRFVWNSYLMKPMVEAGIKAQWLLPLVHGFVGHFPINLPSCCLRLVLIARRSKKFAGTRFLKRGASYDGDVANEVETEQILFNRSVMDFKLGSFSSFVQLRGSVPLIWSQDITKVVGKPPIQIDLADPFACIAGNHFKNLLIRYGGPIVVINLVKRREKSRHESILHEELQASIDYLNQFLSPSEAILYLTFDMARCHKVADSLAKLEEISYLVLQLCGWFQSFCMPFCCRLRCADFVKPEDRHISSDGTFLFQSGIPRTNCVDCLDRTNVAQFVTGKVAFAYQLYSMGILSEPYLSMDHEFCRLLETLYDEHGDALAMQYAGSQLVHSIKTYRKTANLQERSRDVIQTLSRYYSNNFVDFDKQNAINLFLGVVVPCTGKTLLLPKELTTCVREKPTFTCCVDYCSFFSELENHSSYGHLPICELPPWQQQLVVDYFYKVEELTDFNELLALPSRWISTVANTTENTIVASASMVQWFKNRRTGKSRAERVENFSKSSEQDGDESSSDEEGAKSDVEVIYSEDWKDAIMKIENAKVEKGIFLSKFSTCKLSSCRDYYGFELHSLSRDDLSKCKQYVDIYLFTKLAEDDDHKRKLSAPSRLTKSASNFHYIPTPLANYDNCGSAYEVTVPVLLEKSLSTYERVFDPSSWMNSGNNVEEVSKKNQTHGTLV
ncbi:Polyphosphoinositide phosphatase [Trichinella pseudospiralis]|uniref:Polyphosphoinositide phosphatase n=1 Tax=Trichinella pseudospiralis TaxID=6337 RepID=A0A0V1ES43_TRIPS|nr:Polyphosphoinositide phosphatase [Trichinella pseudospiralis]